MIERSLNLMPFIDDLDTLRLKIKIAYKYQVCLKVGEFGSLFLKK